MTGVPVSTLRKWAMGGNVATYMEETPVGQLRMISLQAVYERAEELGRKVSGQPPTAAASKSASKSKPRHRSPSRPAAEPDIPPGTTLVPLDAWNKMMLQLGNLHEAGQQLAEASARAAKAETEATFLKERLAELRAELAKADEREPSPPKREPPMQAMPESDSTPMPPTSIGVLRQIYSFWRRRPRS